jgi:hypothetical protein
MSKRQRPTPQARNAFVRGPGRHAILGDEISRGQGNDRTVGPAPAHGKGGEKCPPV